MALKYYQDRLRKENENKVVQAKVQGDAKPLRVEGVPEVGQFGLQNPPWDFLRSLGGSWIIHKS